MLVACAVELRCHPITARTMFGGRYTLVATVSPAVVRQWCTGGRHQRGGEAGIECLGIQMSSISKNVQVSGTSPLWQRNLPLLEKSNRSSRRSHRTLRRVHTYRGCGFTRFLSSKCFKFATIACEISIVIGPPSFSTHLFFIKSHTYGCRALIKQYVSPAGQR